MLRAQRICAGWAKSNSRWKKRKAWEGCGKAGGLRHREDPKGAIGHCAAPRFSILVILYDFVPELRSQKAKASLKWMGMYDGIKDGIDKHPEGLESALSISSSAQVKRYRALSINTRAAARITLHQGHQVRQKAVKASAMVRADAINPPALHAAQVHARRTSACSQSSFMSFTHVQQSGNIEI
ncbi:hypothetical protein K438DRAFT_1769254 [Mycena galopus ATCC 62051]|nr:hypothetical protein K438DRAFT_1769254 [Mycena galopus ATCC 62051]